MGSLTSKCLAALPIVVCQSRGVHRRMGDCPTEKAGFSTFGNSIVIVRRELGGGKLSLRTRVCEGAKRGPRGSDPASMSSTGVSPSLPGEVVPSPCGCSGGVLLSVLGIAEYVSSVGAGPCTFADGVLQPSQGAELPSHRQLPFRCERFLAVGLVEKSAALVIARAPVGVSSRRWGRSHVIGEREKKTGSL